MIRVLAGQHKGRLLQTAADLSVRPTAEMVRAAVFNMIFSRVEGGEFGAGELGSGDLAKMRFLDVCCGTGAMGIEAASRGFGHIIWCDRDVSLTRANLTKLGLNDSGGFILHQGDAAKPPKIPPGFAAAPATVAFFDPPYDQGLLVPSLAAWLETDWLKKPFFLIAEASRREADMVMNWAVSQNFTSCEQRRYGKAQLVLIT
ncbi:MAG: RsmD family RNA methyltransferase [Candidatus Symbiobacter sp.]|nr:RsmD family RNA methyltransferase [Candidatus Symbiobacter sp.]